MGTIEIIQVIRVKSVSLIHVSSRIRRQNLHRLYLIISDIIVDFLNGSIGAAGRPAASHDIMDVGFAPSWIYTGQGIVAAEKT